MYIYICIAVVQVIRPHNVKPQRELDFSKVYIISLENHEPPEGVVVLRLPAACSPELCFPMNQRLTARWANKNKCFLIMQFSIFHNLTGVTILAMFLT